MNGKWHLFRIFACIISVCIALEILLRLLGFGVHETPVTQIYSQPEQCLVGHNKYGLALTPGEFNVTINDSLEYFVIHSKDSTRLILNEGSDSIQIHFYGCSFTYGMGVDNDKIFPALLQQEYPHINYKNYAVPGYGTIQSLLQFEENVSLRKAPKMIVLGYTSFQDARNQLSGIQQKYWKESFTDIQAEEKEIRFPYVKISKDSLEKGYRTFDSFEHRWRLSKYSVFIHRVENTISNIVYGRTDKHELTEMIIEEMAAICDRENIVFLVMLLNKDDASDELSSFCQSHEIHCLDAALDISDRQFNLEPFDSHPNKLAHRYFSDKLIAFLEKEELFSN